LPAATNFRIIRTLSNHYATAADIIRHRHLWCIKRGNPYWR